MSGPCLGVAQKILIFLGVPTLKSKVYFVYTLISNFNVFVQGIEQTENTVFVC